jgi:hypothetical protein
MSMKTKSTSHYGWKEILVFESVCVCGGGVWRVAHDPQVPASSSQLHHITFLPCSQTASNYSLGPQTSMQGRPRGWNPAPA